ncbi:putative transcription factor protein [Rosellinia necatrix]|uniref:Putative transcription factor protein n=1 Tax=Rosellinia necatrix TaxID=77044 RepID=A0A1S7UNJ6_ROSNE|nr:putative transcription factor protein [Rosellinia necatrix]
MKPGSSGFPEHKKRSKFSAFKQKRHGIQPDVKGPEVFLSSSGQPLRPSDHVSGTTPASRGFHADEKESIHRENNQMLASMSPQEIERARQELFGGLDQSTLEMLLRRANLDQDANTFTIPLDEPQPILETTSTHATPTDAVPETRPDDTSIDTTPNTRRDKDVAEPRTVSADTLASIPPQPHIPSEADKPDHLPPGATQPNPNPNPNPGHDAAADDDSAPSIPPAEYIIEPPSAADGEGGGDGGAHWPRARQPADLDPADPDFLQNLHAKYFPSLPADPSKLAWMAPLPTPGSPADLDSPYHPGQGSLPVSALRFDFRGALLPPRVSRALPVSAGLHHHGEAPEAAGYTVRELARLARSAVPGQRCLAYQTLGRLLYRLGAGAFGTAAYDSLAVGIWRQVEDGAVLRSLYDEIEAGEAGRGRGHRSARAFATEAIWLFEKGGWKQKLQKA